MSNWGDFCLPGTKYIKKYNLEKNSKDNYLRLDTDSSVTGLIYTKIFNPYEFPQVSWKWKTDNIFKKGDGEYKTNNDYPIWIFYFYSTYSE